MSSDGTGIFETEVEIDLQGRRIYSGLAANVDIEIATHEGLVVPSQAIVDRLVEELPDDIQRDIDCTVCCLADRFLQVVGIAIYNMFCPQLFE